MTAAAIAQPAPSPTNTPASTAPNQDSQQVLEYLKFLREEEKAHREYFESLYTRTTVVLGLLVTLGVGLIGFLQFKSRKDVKEAVDARFRRTVDQEFKRSIDQFNTKLAAAMAEVNDDVDQRVEAVIAGATQKFEELLFAAVPAQVEVTDSWPGSEPSVDFGGGKPAPSLGFGEGKPAPSLGVGEGKPAPSLEEAIPAALDLSDEEREILHLMDQSKYSFRSLSGLTSESSLNKETVRRTIDTLTRKGLMGRTLGKKGGVRWFITEAGRKYLMSDKA